MRFPLAYLVFICLRLGVTVGVCWIAIDMMREELESLTLALDEIVRRL